MWLCRVQMREEREAVIDWQKQQGNRLFQPKVIWAFDTAEPRAMGTQ